MTLTFSGHGAFSSQDIETLIQQGAIINAEKEHISPASLDLTISDEAYRVEEIFLPKTGETVRDVLKSIEVFPHDFSNPLERDVTYLFLLNEKISLPEDVYGYCNPKSTTGRNDVHARVIADGVSRYDAVTPKGFRGELWVAVTPKSFPIKLAKGMPLSQLRLFNKDTHFTEGECKDALETYGLLWDLEGRKYSYEEIKIRDNDGSIILTLDLSQDIAGYECHGSNKVLDFSKGAQSHNPAGFFERIRIDRKRIHLKKGSFYVLSSCEAVRVPPDLTCEMAPMDERSGEFRSHYAGFIDPGWGWGKNGEGKGRPLTLEMRPFEDIVIRHGQPIGKIKFERVTQIPNMLYDTKASNYLAQTGPKLSKHFKELA